MRAAAMPPAAVVRAQFFIVHVETVGRTAPPRDFGR
jgi:hypothetical protein